MQEVAVNTALEGSIDGEGGVYLIVGGEKFEARKVSVSWHMMRFAKAQQATKIRYPHPLDDESTRDDHVETCKACKEVATKRNEAGMHLLSIMYDVTQTLLKPRERDRFGEFMADAELKPDELENAIGECIAAIGGDKGKQQAPRSDSSASEQTTNVPSRTISWSQGSEVHQDVT